MPHLEGEARAPPPPLCGISVEGKGVFVVLAEGRVLLLLAQHGVADHQALDIGAHKAAKGVLGRAHDRLAAHIERGIDDYRAARESRNCSSKTIIGLVPRYTV